MENAEPKLFVNDLDKVNLHEHTYCQVQGESKQNGCKIQRISDGVQTVEEGELLNENSENNSNAWNSSNLNKKSQSAAMDNYTGKVISGESNMKEKNIFQNIGDLCPDVNEEGGCVGDLNLQNITLNWPPITHSFKRKSHKSYLATWSAQISCDGFAKCLIETCNFISLDLQTMQDHYKACNGIPNYDYNSCSSCSCWLPSGNELAMHESNCKGKKKDSSIALPKSKDLNEAETNQSEIKDDNHICVSPKSKSCRRLSAENSGEMPNEERQMKYCDECDIEFFSDTEFSQHLICKKNWLETLPGTEKREGTRPQADTSQENVIDENNHIVQPGRPIFQGEYVRRRSFTKQHKIAWETAMKKHKYVKCIFQNCHFLALSVEDMIYHYGYCNGDGSFAKFVCHFCGGRLTRKNLLEIHVRRSHANEQIDENKFRSMEIQNEDSRPTPRSDDNDSSGSDLMSFGEFDLDFPQGAPLEVEITEDSTTFDWQEKAHFGGSVNEEEIETSDDLQKNNKCNSDAQTNKWGIDFRGSHDSTRTNNSRYSAAEELNLLEEGNPEHFMVDTSQDNAQKNHHPPEVCGDRDYRNDHIYSKVKIRTTSESESKDSLSVKKKKNLKHYPSKKHINEESLRVTGEETVSEKESDAGKEIKEESQLNKSVSVADASGKNARKMIATPSPASQNILKREVLPYYTSIWTDSLETNGFARCLVATCNFISLNLLHVQNHFKNCNGVPEKGPNLCTFCESRLPSSVELQIHKSTCKANGEADSSSSGIPQSLGECKKNCVSENRTGESSNNGETENRRELNENEYKAWEESDSFKSNKDAAGGEVSPRKENANSLRIGEIMKLKNKEIVDYNRIIQPGPVLPEGHYLRRRSYSKTHKAAWEAALEKHKYVKCLFQNCHFLAMSLEDMIYHFGYCIGDGSFAKFECPHCGGRLTSKVVLDIHIQRSHSDKLSNENDQTSNEEGTEVLLCTLDDWKKLMAKRELKTYAKNSPRLSIVVLQPEEAKTTENSLEEIQDNSSSPNAPPIPKRQCRIRTSSEEVDECSDIYNSISDSKNNDYDSSADNQTSTNNDDNNTSESQTSRARNPCDEGDDQENQENTGNTTNSVPAAGKAKIDDLVQIPGECDVIKDSSDNQETPESTCNTKKISNISSEKGNPRTPRKRNDERKASKGNPRTAEKPNGGRRHSHGDSGSPERSNDGRQPSEGNPRAVGKSIDERKASKGNIRTAEKPNDIRKPSETNERTGAKPIDERRRSHGNPGSPEKPNFGRQPSKGNPRTAEKSNDGRRPSHGNSGTSDDPTVVRRRSHEDSSSPEKPIDQRKPSERNPRTAEKPIDGRRRSHEDSSSPEKPIDQRKPSERNPRTAEKPIDGRRRSHGNSGTSDEPTVVRRRSHEDSSSPEKPNVGRQPSKGNPKTAEKSNDGRRRSRGDSGSTEKPVDQRKPSERNPRTAEKPNDGRRPSHGNSGTSDEPTVVRRRSHEDSSSPEKPIDEGRLSHEDSSSPENPIDERKRLHGNPGSPGKPNVGRQPSKGNSRAAEKPIDERKLSKGNPRTAEKPNDERKPSKGNPRTAEKPNDERKPSKGNPRTAEKPSDGRQPSEGNPRTAEKPNDERKPSKGNPRAAGKPNDERKPSKGNKRTAEKPIDEQKSSHGNTNTSSLVLEKNSNTKKQETEKERKSLRQNTKTENKNSNKNDQETKHDIRPRRKRGRSSKSLSKEDLSEEENVKDVLNNSDAEVIIHEANDHDCTQNPRAKVAKIEPPKSESNVEETLSPPVRKRGRPPKKKSLICKVLEVEAKGVVEETPEQAKIGGNARKRKSEPEEKKQIVEKRTKVKCANCDFECERRLFTDHNHKKHAGLSWIEGENPIDLNDEDAVSWNIKQAFRHIKSATCAKCGNVKKSALGFISHVQNCGKSEEEKAALKVKCPHCPARILKYSLPVHLKLYHFDLEGNKSSQEKVSVGELPMKRKSALRAVNKFCEVLSQEDDEEETKKKVHFVAYEKGVSKFPKLPGKTRNLWMKMIKEKKKIPCRRGSCLTESSSVQEAKTHHFMCSELPRKCYVCERCDFFTESKSVIQKHVDIHPKVDGDYRLGSEEEKSEDEADMKYAEDDESEFFQKKMKTLVTCSDENALEASLKTRFFAREGLLNVRQMRFCGRSLRMTLESEMEEVKKYSPVFPELRTQASDWIHVKPENAIDHFPSLRESISFRVNNAKKKSESDWKKIKRFQGEIIEDSAVIFTGGSILSMSWCKYSCFRSCQQDPKQYLAVSSSRKMEKFQNIHEERGDAPSLIQIYNCGEMKIYNDVVDVPEMAMGIVHEYGEVWDLAWFPLDAFEHSENETFLTRIGLLGAACQDGTIKIWPICDPDELKPKHSLPLYKIHPKAILELEDKADVGCLRLAIGRTGTVVGGYAGGLVAVWNLKTISSPFTKTVGKSSILKPIVSFQAHKTSITALSMCQNSDRYICTSGLDRYIKFWDLECPGNPFESLQKEVCLDNVWPKHWPLTISTLEDILPASGKGMIKAVRELYCDKHRSPLALEGTCWSLSFNEWLNILCGCNNIGEVKIRFLRNLFLTDETFRYRTGHVVCQTDLKLLKDLSCEKVEDITVESCKGKSKKNGKKQKQAEEISAVPRTYDEAWKYFGLVFHDPIIEEESKQRTNQQSKSSKKGSQCLEDYPITSVNKVCWNPNYKRFMQLAIGHHCGLIRIKPVKDVKCNEDVLRFLAESEDEIGKSRLE